MGVEADVKDEFFFDEKGCRIGMTRTGTVTTNVYGPNGERLGYVRNDGSGTFDANGHRVSQKAVPGLLWKRKTQP